MMSAVNSTLNPDMTAPILILIVDDDEAIRDLVAQALEDIGYATLGASDAAAVTLAATHHPSLVLLDIMMPIMDGIEVSRQLRADSTTRDIPIIAMSARAQRTIPPGMEANGYLAKPFDLDELYDTVERWAGIPQ